MKKHIILVLTFIVLLVGSPSLISAAGTTGSKVNDYIFSQNLAPIKVQNDYKSSFPNFTYRNGFGEVEGVVVHETGNDNSTITGEISYMSKNYQNAFVHAFVDGSHVIEIHSLDYGAWGAGKYANQRFVHVELVRAKTFDEFARSVNNDANYIANILYRYNLPLIDAGNTGTGTLWSHNAVTKFLGGTTHTDPIDYFQKWGYSWDQFVQLVASYYQKLPDKIADTNRLGQIRNSNISIYQNYNDSTSSMKADDSVMNQTFYIKKLAFFGKQTYYLLSRQPSSTDGVVGWVKAADVITYPNTLVDQSSKTLYFTGNGSAYSKPWGAKNDVVFGSLSDDTNLEFKINRTEMVGNAVWYQGSLAGKTVWMDAGNLNQAVESAASRLGNIQNGTVKIYKNLGSSSPFQAGTAYINKVYYIKRQAKLGSQTYYLLSGNETGTSPIGWVLSTDFISRNYENVSNKVKNLCLSGNGSAYSKPWGGTKDVVFAKLSVYKKRSFTVKQTAMVDSTYWYYGVLAGKNVWLIP
ncbi:SH3-like domain-containing protein [Bacillus sp. BRMEA1]|uniref:GW dipeptide domain-containing protein n=1 Tax=Neobacillus endophyticus TaxID=2738405 RepID=UPI001563A4EC|nr:GW dipeptide domain-containing protein [Neobacillus endophyticus]NRD76832.1 SH3-like domain-containing protein [Neobacillus endophyticus]